MGRGIGGIGVGALRCVYREKVGGYMRSTSPHSMLSPLYMAEISPPEVRGSLMALEQFAIVLGAVLGFWTGFFTRDSTYPHACMRCIALNVPSSRRISFMADTSRHPAHPRHPFGPRWARPPTLTATPSRSRTGRRGTCLPRKTPTTFSG